jgi:hypothetical protein
MQSPLGLRGGGAYYSFRTRRCPARVAPSNGARRVRPAARRRMAAPEAGHRHGRARSGRFVPPACARAGVGRGRRGAARPHLRPARGPARRARLAGRVPLARRGRRWPHDRLARAAPVRDVRPRRAARPPGAGRTARLGATQGPGDAAAAARHDPRHRRAAALRGAAGRARAPSGAGRARRARDGAQARADVPRAERHAARRPAVTA